MTGPGLQWLLLQVCTQLYVMMMMMMMIMMVV
jgi:hypothetical protein